jgi:hypothetical protein
LRLKLIPRRGVSFLKQLVTNRLSPSKKNSNLETTTEGARELGA